MNDKQLRAYLFETARQLRELAEPQELAMALADRRYAEQPAER